MARQNRGRRQGRSEIFNDNCGGGGGMSDTRNGGTDWAVHISREHNEDARNGRRVRVDVTGICGF